MTLSDCFEALGNRPAIVFAFFGFLIVSALIAGVLGKGEGEESPWKWLYAALVYLTSVPGIFAVALSIYFFIFERRSILETDILVQIVPVISMVATLLIIKTNVDLDKIPGFGKLSGLLMVIFATIAFMWFIDRVRLFVFSYLPFQYLFLIFVALFVVLYFGWTKIMKEKKSVAVENSEAL